MSSYGMI